MVSITIDLSDESNTFVDMFKSHKGIKSKNATISKIIEEFQDLKKEEFTEKILGYECSLMSEKALAKDWLSKEDEEAFSYLQ
jgi:hypothetical protein